MPQLSSITVYPIKSLDGVACTSARVLPSGALDFDRRWALVDPDGIWVTAKRTPLIHRIRAEFDLAARSVTLACPGTLTRQSFTLAPPWDDLNRALSECLQQPVRLIENDTTGYPDDSDSPGPTIAATASVEAIAAWYPGCSADEVRRRFRFNLEVVGVEPFWEDRLFGLEGDSRAFRVGSVEFSGTNPCRRCVVPTRNSTTGERTADFAQHFAERRERTRPAWAEPSRFDQHYRFTTNTRLARSSWGGTIHVGDDVKDEG